MQDTHAIMRAKGTLESGSDMSAFFYHSTRNNEQAVTSKQAILQGIAPDGGLYVSDQLGDEPLGLEGLSRLGYHRIAHAVLGTLLGDFSRRELTECIQGAYGTNFDTSAVTPLSPVGPDWLLELFHGPTCAFKDVALQMLPRLMVRAQKRRGTQVMIVTATSGDTGKAALAGFSDVAGTAVTVFYPAGKVSDIQRLQMVTQTGANVAVAGIRGTFDDAQTEVKKLFADRSLNARLARDGVSLSSANSINIGRLAPQVAYYFSAYSQLVKRGAITEGDDIDFCVPTGNFGDVLAGYYAKRMGLPVGRLIVASNTNKVLTDFLATGVYDRRREFVKTISPSMDILVSSNLERLLYYESGGDCELVSHLMGQLAEEGRYDVGSALLARIRESFDADFATDDETRATIRQVWEEERTLIDPHTAVAMHVLRKREPEGRARVCLSTASPYKFSRDVLEALGRDVDGMDGFACMDELQLLTHTKAPAPLARLRNAPIIHHDICYTDEMGAFIEQAAARIFL